MYACFSSCRVFLKVRYWYSLRNHDDCPVTISGREMYMNGTVGTGIVADLFFFFSAFDSSSYVGISDSSLSWYCDSLIEFGSVIILWVLFLVFFFFLIGFPLFISFLSALSPYAWCGAMNCLSPFHLSPFLRRYFPSHHSILSSSHSKITLFFCPPTLLTLIFMHMNK